MINVAKMRNIYKIVKEVETYQEHKYDNIAINTSVRYVHAIISTVKYFILLYFIILNYMLCFQIRQYRHQHLRAVRACVHVVRLKKSFYFILLYILCFIFKYKKYRHVNIFLFYFNYIKHKNKIRMYKYLKKYRYQHHSTVCMEFVFR